LGSKIFRREFTRSVLILFFTVSSFANQHIIINGPSSEHKTTGLFILIVDVQASDGLLSCVVAAPSEKIGKIENSVLAIKNAKGQLIARTVIQNQIIENDQTFEFYLKDSHLINSIFSLSHRTKNNEIIIYTINLGTFPITKS
jgi:hypothetical protein